MKALRATHCYQAAVFLNESSKENLQWRIQNLQSFNGYYLIQPQKYLDNKGVFIQERLDCILSENPNGREMEFIGTTTYKTIGYKSIRNDGRKYYCNIL